jgi:catechol 2,3-dioxygenase-like lactoylglutathione lyase family enzyme
LSGRAGTVTIAAMANPDGESGERGDGGDGARERLRFDAVRLGAEDAEAAARAYAIVLGAEPLRLASGRWRFQLERGAVEIAAGPPGLRALCFAAADRALADADFHGLEVRTTPVVSSAELPPAAPAPGARDVPSPRAPEVADTATPATAARAIDHVVVATTDLERALALWRDRLGVRLALDREFPRRGLRMLFFRSGGVTLEFVGVLGARDPAGRDRLDGVAYEVVDLAAYRERLAAAGLDVSPVRDGNKPGSRVATVRSGTTGVPTLLIEHLDRAAWRAEPAVTGVGPGTESR